MKPNNTNPDRHYQRVQFASTLRKAWAVVRESALSSDAIEIRNEAQLFSARAETNISRISKELRERRFVFKPAKGIRKKRPGKSARPIVIAPLETRIVQRSILDTIQSDVATAPLYSCETSFGGIAKRGVREAVARAYKAIISADAKYYLRTDIEDFFRNIPRDIPISQLAKVIPVGWFIELLERATQTELSNLESLGQDRELFPIHEIGVAQGCCLSPLMGNIVLAEFDRRMNGSGILCLRYVDDFIILSASAKKVKGAFRSAKSILSDIGFQVYDPLSGSTKAEFGETAKGFQFLGCDVRPGLIRPHKKSRQGILERIRSLLEGADLRLPLKS